jgi:HEAT repeat protein
MHRRITYTAIVASIVMPAACFAQETSTADKKPTDQAWPVLYTGLAESNVEKRTTAVQVLGLLPDDAKAKEAALKALTDEKPDVRAAAAQSLGDMKAKDTTNQLYEMFNDTDAGVVIAAARSLIALGDSRGYNVYYAVLTGERKTGQGLKEEQKKMLNDPKKLAKFGFEQGIGFIPFAGLGYGAVKLVTKDTTSPVLAAAALMLVKDPDPKSGEAIANAATGNKSWIVRAAALNALALRGQTSLLPAAESGLQDEREEVRYSAAAAVIRLSDLSARPVAAPKKAPAPKAAPKKK